MEPDRNVKKTVNFGVRRLALLSILTALCYVGRMMFQFIPNVQPVTAVLIILTLPIVCVYPFLQKYFVKGVMVGAIKE